MSVTTPITVVTAYYEIKSKFTPEKYWQWINNFCNNPFSVVIFTSENLVERFNTFRRKYSDKTKIVSIPFEELYHYKFKNIYEEHRKKDTESKHTSDLYIIWAEKIKFVMRAIELNPFNSNNFIWCDIGAFRLENLLIRYKTFPRLVKI